MNNKKEINIGYLSLSNYLQIKELQKVLKNDKKVVFEDYKERLFFLKDQINKGLRLDTTFSFGASSGWSYSIVEEIIYCYELWMLGVIKLVNSEYSKKEKIRYRYVDLVENAGVTGLTNAALHPAKLIKNNAGKKQFIPNEMPQVINQGIRSGETGLDGFIVAGNEAKRQFSNAKSSLTKKLKALGKLLKNNEIGSDKMIIYIDRKGRIISRRDASKGLLEHRFSKKSQHRSFDDFAMILLSENAISAKKLAGGRTIQAVSKQIKATNKKLIESLVLKNPIVINEKNTGYKVDLRYFLTEKSS